MRVTRLLFCTLLLTAALPSLALAAATDPISFVPAPTQQGDIFSPGFRLAADVGYVEEEFFVSGKSDAFTYNDPPVREEIIPIAQGVPYTARIVVRRPADASSFNGPVVIELWNSTAGFDTAPV
jgi:hypothetical protein